MGAGKTGNDGKCKRSMRVSESWGEKITEVEKYSQSNIYFRLKVKYETIYEKLEQMQHIDYMTQGNPKLCFL